VYASHDTRGRIKVSSRGFRDAIPADQPVSSSLADFAVAPFFRAEGVQSKSIPLRRRVAPWGLRFAASASWGLMEVRRQAESVLRRRTLYWRLLRPGHRGKCRRVPSATRIIGPVFGGERLHGGPSRAAVFVGAVDTAATVRGCAPSVVAYAGVPHVSADINGRGCRHSFRTLPQEWADHRCTRRFADALRRRNYAEAGEAMNREVDLRRRMSRACSTISPQAGAAPVAAAAAPASPAPVRRPVSGPSAKRCHRFG